METGRPPYSLAVGDLNEDGFPDVVASNPESNTASIILSHAGAVFGPATEIPLGTRPTVTAIADLDGDGHLDLVVGVQFEFYSGVSILKGRGDGSFGERTDVSLRGYGDATSIVTGNFDAGPTVDIAVFFASSASLELLLSNGDGTYSTNDFWINHDVQNMIAADLNHDGKLDLATAGGGFPFGGPTRGFVSVFIGNGDGSFANPTDFDAGFVPRALVATDLNADGHLDLAVANGYGNSVSILLGNGDGTFGTKTDYGVGRGPISLAAGDVNGDGRIDLLTSDAGSRTITILSNRGTAPPNRAPTAHAGGPYAGTAGVPIAFSGLSSSDPEGSPLTYLWAFGDGAEGVGAEPSHTYRAGGAFAVVLHVSDGALEDRDTTSADVSETIPARAFLTLRAPLIAGAGPPSTCFQVEPVAGDYVNSDVLLSSIVLESTGTGSVSEIPAVQGKENRVSDLDHNGVPEISTCFRREDLDHLFAGLHGKRKLPVSLEGTLTTGARFRAPMELNVIRPGGSLFAFASSNPLRSGGTLSFLSPEPDGPVRVQLFDAAGRLVRTIADPSAAEAGLVNVSFDGRSNGGAAIPSGVYFYKVSTTTGNTTGRIVFVR